MCRSYPRFKSKNQQSAFTLVELVLVIVLLGIIAAASTQFIRQGVGIYSDSVERDRLQQMARFAIERMSRELRNALPGSVRIGGSAGGSQCIEFMASKAASTYLGSVAGGPISSLNMVDVGYSYASGDWLVIYPIAANNIYSSPSAMAALSGDGTVTGNERTLPFASHSFPAESPTRRVFIATGPISFCVEEGKLTRHQGYPLTASQTVLPGSEVLLAENIRLTDDGTAVKVFDYAAGTPVRSGVVHLDLRFSNTARDEWIRFSQEVFVRNTP